MASLAFLRTLRRREFHTASLSAYKSIAANEKTSLIERLGQFARPFCSRRIGSDLGTSNSCVAVIGKTPSTTPSVSAYVNTSMIQRRTLGGIFTKMMQCNSMIPTNKFQEVRGMATLRQLIRTGRDTKHRTDRTRALGKCPQKAAVCLRVSTRTPKKPNSALRKIAKVKLSNGNEVFSYIPGEGHNLQEHSQVLVRGGRVKDLPGVKFHCIRGPKDLLGITERRRGRSKYGTPKPKE